MIAGVQKQATLAELAATRQRYLGEVVYLYAFDVAYEMIRQPVERLLGHPVEPFRVGVDKRIPRHQLFCQPQMVRLPAVDRVGPHGPVKMQRVVKVMPVGAISINIRIPFDVERIEDLVIFHDLQFKSGSLNDEVRQLADQVRRELASACRRPVAQLGPEEAYTVFCFEAPLTNGEGSVLSGQGWLESHRREVAALLTQETDIELLSQLEVEESTDRFLSYYRNDLVVIDWDAALIVDEPADFAETIYVMELANLQLAELEAYDRMLDTALERSYRDLASRPWHSRVQALKEIQELCIDLARLSDELSNITKFFGDWHLARVYSAIASRFHLGDWHHTLDEKLKTLDTLYQALKHDRDNRWMLMLEITIVLLFIVDLALLFHGKGP